MNTCILMAKILTNPELRYTQDSQLPIAQMLIEFAGVAPNDPPSRVKAVGWGNLATEIQQTYHEGEQVILQGRLKMNTIDRQEGFKEKRAELTISHIYKVGDITKTSSTENTFTQDSNNNTNNVVSLNANSNSQDSETNNHYQEMENEGIKGNDLDDIPF